MALFLGASANDLANLKATRELLERLEKKIAAARGNGSEAEAAGFLDRLAAAFAAESASEQAFVDNMIEHVELLARSDLAAMPSIVQAARASVAEQFKRRRSPLAVQRVFAGFYEQLLQRIFSVVGEGAPAWCLLAGGALGRREASFGLSVAGCYIGEWTPQLAATVTAMLQDCAITIDSRPITGGFHWFRTPDDWLAAVAALTASGDERCASLADLRVIAGDAAMGGAALMTARGGLARWRQSSTFAQAARQVSGMRLARGFFGGLRVERSGEHRGAINIDTQALSPLVANVRIMVIGQEITETGTPERIKELVRRGRLNVEPAQRALEAYHHLQGWKMLAEQTSTAPGELEGYVWPERLSDADQESFRDCLDAVAAIERLVLQSLVGA